MASIIKRKKNYSVVYNYVDENGETKQKWETWHTHKEALKRKAEIENQQHTGTFLPPSNQTITEFLYDFVSLYGEKKWGASGKGLLTAKPFLSVLIVSTRRLVRAL